MFLLTLLPLLKVVNALSTIPGGRSCPNLNTTNDYGIIYDTTQITFQTFATETRDFEGIDNLCYTFSRLPDGPNTYLVHASFVFFNGSNLVRNLVATTVSPGVSLLSSQLASQLQYHLGPTCCGATVNYACNQCGQDFQRFGFGISSTYGRIPDRCLDDAIRKLAAQNLFSGPITIFPMHLPPKCYIPPKCPNHPHHTYPCGNNCGNICSC